MATDPTGLIAGLLKSAGLGSTPGAVAADNIARQSGMLQNQMGALQVKAAQAQQQRAAQYQAQLVAYGQDPTPQRLGAFIAAFPEKAKEIQDAHAALDAPAQASRAMVLSSIYNAANNNRPDLIGQQIDKVIQAEKDQGVDTTEAESIKAGLASKDPAAIKQALAFSQAQLALINPEFAKKIGIGGDQDHFASTGDNAIYDKRDGHISRDGVSSKKITQVPIYDDQGHRVGTQLIDESGNVVEGGDQVSSAGGATPGSTSGAPRSVRNNNPGNIVDSQFARSQTGYKGSDGRFAIFESPAAGSGAQAALLKNYLDRGFNTVGKIINRWAPPSDGNDTSAYVRNVAKALNVSPSDTLSPSSIPALQAAIARQEGTASNPSNGGAVAAQGASGAKGYFGPVNGSAGVDDSVVGPAYIAALNPGRANLLRAIHDGRAPAPKPGSRFGQALAEDLARAYPDEDNTTFQTRQQTRNDFTKPSGKGSQNIDAINRFFSHLNSAYQSHLKLGGPNLGPLSGIAAGISQSFSPGTVNDYNTEIDGLQGEFQKLTKNGQGNESEAARLIANAKAAQSEDGRLGALRALAKLAAAQVDPIRSSWVGAFGNGTPLPKDITPASQAVYRNIMAGGSHALPVGRDGAIVTPHTGFSPAQSAGQPTHISTSGQYGYFPGKGWVKIK